MPEIGENPGINGSNPSSEAAPSVSLPPSMPEQFGTNNPMDVMSLMRERPTNEVSDSFEMKSEKAVFTPEQQAAYIDRLREALNVGEVDAARGMAKLDPGELGSMWTFISSKMKRGDDGPGGRPDEAAFVKGYQNNLDTIASLSGAPVPVKEGILEKPAPGLQGLTDRLFTAPTERPAGPLSPTSPVKEGILEKPPAPQVPDRLFTTPSAPTVGPAGPGPSGGPVGSGGK